MNRYQFTPQALDDLFEISAFIAKDNPDAADRIERAIFRACEFLADLPLMGQTRRDLTHWPVRFWAVLPAYRSCPDGPLPIGIAIPAEFAV